MLISCGEDGPLPRLPDTDYRPGQESTSGVVLLPGVRSRLRGRGVYNGSPRNLGPVLDSPTTLAMGRLSMAGPDVRSDYQQEHARAECRPERVAEDVPVQPAIARHDAFPHPSRLPWPHLVPISSVMDQR